MSADRELSEETRLIHLGRSQPMEGVRPVSPPVVRTSTVLAPDIATMRANKARREDGSRVFSYGARGTPTNHALEEAWAALEGGERALLFPTGLAAIAHVLLTCLLPGSHVLIQNTVYPQVHAIRSKFLDPRGIASTYFDGTVEDAAAKITPATRMIYAENPGSWVYDLIDVKALSTLAHDHNALLVIDNTWASGLLHKPLLHGADISVIAGTKYVVGHSDVMMGAVVANGELGRELWRMQVVMGQTVSPDDAWLTLRGLRTIAARLPIHASGALRIARFLQDHPLVERVLHPALESHPRHDLWRRDFTGANGLLTIGMRPDLDLAAVDRFVDTLRLFGIGSSWGGFESLALPQAPDTVRGWTGPGVPVRLHIGLENPADLEADLARGLAAIG